MRASQYNICVIIVSLLKILEYLSLILVFVSRYEKYYCLVLKFLIILSYVDV